jgi:hypothetical protein
VVAPFVRKVVAKITAWRITLWRSRSIVERKSYDNNIDSKIRNEQRRTPWLGFVMVWKKHKGKKQEEKNLLSYANKWND